MKTKFTNQEDQNDSFVFDSNTLSLPTRIDLTSKGKIVKSPEFGEYGYAENIEYELTINFRNGILHIDYYGEDDTFLSNIYPNWANEIINNLDSLI